MSKDSNSVLHEAVNEAASDPGLVQVRMSLAHFAADTFSVVGEQLHVFGHIFGVDRVEGKSPYGHGNDATVAVSMLLRIASQLLSASADLFADGRPYAGSALIRQLVEIEYLAWAFENQNDESARWLRSTRKERKSFFTPAKLRNAAGGRFRGVDYGYHCELGGHPVPGSWILLNDDQTTPQLMLSDALGHAGRIWDHVAGWAEGNLAKEMVIAKTPEMLKRFMEWKSLDPLTKLPQPPAEFPSYFN